MSDIDQSSPVIGPDLSIDVQYLTSGVSSPFLPETDVQYAWDSTSLGYLKTCPRLYQYIMIEGWAPREDSVHLRFGGEYHKALENYDTAKASGLPHSDAMEIAVRLLLETTADFVVDETAKAGKYKNRKTLVALVIDYLDQFENDPMETVILDDGKPAVELSFRFELDWGPKTGTEGRWIGSWDSNPNETVDHGPAPAQPYLLSGHLDRLVRFQGDYMIMDRKTTTTSLSQYYFKQYEPSNQMTLYTLAGSVILNAPVKGVIIDAAQIKLTEPHAFARGFTYRTSDQLEEWLIDLKVLLASAEGYALAGYWPMNDTACDKFGGCKFRDICSKSPSVRDAFLRADFNKLAPAERWNPLRSR